MGYTAIELELASKFRSDHWENMTVAERHRAVEELTKYSAEKLGHDVPKVEFKSMDDNICGYQGNGKITFNSNFIDDCKFITHKDNGDVIEHVVDNPGAEVMSTVFHEDTHAHQEAISNLEVPVDNLSLEYFKDTVAGGLISTYIDPNYNYIMYRSQPDENEAFTRGTEETVSMLKATESIYGPDEGVRAFEEATENDQKYYVGELKKMFNDENADKALAAAIRDRFYGTDEAVNKYGETGESMTSILRQSEIYNIQNAEKQSRSMYPKGLSDGNGNENTNSREDPVGWGTDKDQNNDHADGISDYFESIKNDNSAWTSKSNNKTNGISM